MNFKRVFIILLMLSLLAVLGVSSVSAQSSINQTFTSSVTYYTPSDTGGTLQINFYAEGSDTAIPYPAITLNPHAAGSIYMGNVSQVGSSFVGSAVLSSDVPVIATVVQIAGDANEYPRPLYSGFSEGAATFFVPTILRRQFGGTSSEIAVQNLESSAIDATLKFFAVGATTPTVNRTYSIAGNSTLVIRATDDAKIATGTGTGTLPDGFNGALVIEATGKVVASSQELKDNGRAAYAFEGVASGAQELFMASAICDAFGGQTSFYAIQNTSLTQSTNVTVDFYDKAGQKVGEAQEVITPGGKKSINPCTATPDSAPAGTSGSAVISSDTTDVIAIGKVSNANNSAFITSFVGDVSGATKVAAPYIRWSADKTKNIRSFVAIMNVGSGDATDIKVHYYDADGSLAATHTVANASNPLPPLIKVNTNPSTAGALNANGNFGIRDSVTSKNGGSIEVISDQPVVVVVRGSQEPIVNGAGTQFAEDYNGTAFE
jgi:hypothetical protein